uniref:Uncharacterized protein n=2 Tax=Rhizophora mucronata TaxID=61149 RepID=A0A2P2JJG4_RHIMU
MVHGLCQVQLAHRWKHTKCITSQQDDIPRVWTNTRYLCIGNVLNRVRCSSVLCNRFISIIHLSRVVIKHHIFQHSSKLDGIPDIRLLFP